MSFFHPSPAATARTRRTKDGQGRINTSNTNRRPKDGVKGRDERSPTPKSPNLQQSIYGQQNVGLEQIGDLSISGKTSPTLAASPTVSAIPPNKRSSGMYQIPLQLVTPASLQQYLDTDQDDEVTSNMTDSLHLPPPLPVEISSKKNSDSKEQLAKDADVREPKESRESKEPREPKEPRELRELREPRESREARESRESKDFRDPRESREPKEPRERRESRGVRESRERRVSRDLRDSREFREFREAKDFQDEPAKTIQEDIKSLRSEPAEGALTKTTSINGSIASNHEYAPPLSRSTSQATHTTLPHERSFTPPALPLGMVQSQSPPLYMSPMPVRAHGPAQHFMSYNGGHGLYGTRGSIPPESAQGQMQTPSFLPDYAARPTPLAPAAAQRQQSYDTATLSHSRRNRSFSYTGFEDDTSGLLHRINSVLPDFHLLLDRYRDVSGHFSGEPKATDEEAEARFEQELKAKDAQIALLEKEIQTNRDDFTSERENLQKQLGAIQKSHGDLQASFSQTGRSRDELRDQARELQNRNDNIIQQFKQAQFLVDQLRAEVAHTSATNAELSKQLEIRGRADASLREELEASLEAKMDLSKQLADKEKSESRSRAELEASIKAKEKELHDKDMRIRETEIKNLAAQEALRQETVRAVASHRRELEESQKKEIVAREAWRSEVEASQKREAQLRNSHNQEKEARIRQWSNEREELVRHWEGRWKAQSEQHDDEKEDLHQTWRASQNKLQSRHSQLEAEATAFRTELERIRASWQADKSRWTRNSTDLRTLAGRINSENHNLQKMIEAMGEVPQAPQVQQRRADAAA